MSLRMLWRAILVAVIGLAAFALYGLATQRASGSLAVAGVAALLLGAPVIPIVALRWLPAPASSMMLRARRRLRTRGSALAFEWVGLRQISSVMCLGAIAAEDAYFRDHDGFDWQSIREAHAHNQAHTKKRGGSTITQQVAKNLFLWPARSYVRKAIEAYLTVLLEALWPKRRILEMYLNIAQFGEDVFGVQAAARRYFDKRAQDIGQHEAALLAAALPNPVKYRVEKPSHQLRFRQSWVLAAMRRLGDSYLERL